MGNIFSQIIQLDKEGELHNPYERSQYRCRNCEHSEIKKGINKNVVCYCNFYKKYVSLNSKKDCFR